MRSGRRLFALALAVLVLLAVLFPAFYIALEADHDCAGEDCGICLSIRQCVSLLHRVISAAVVLCALMTALLLAPLAVAAPAAGLRQPTLTSRKIRLNN
jgi:hypothetical protein